MEKRTLAQIDAEIEETRAALKDVHGTETEVYARIVGYYRAVKHWNKGKRDEFDQRKMFTLEASKEYDITAADQPCVRKAPAKMSAAEPVTELNSVTYEMYTRQTCPNGLVLRGLFWRLEEWQWTAQPSASMARRWRPPSGRYIPIGRGYFSSIFMCVVGDF